MNNTLRTVLITVGVIAAAAVLVLAGLFIGRATWGFARFQPGNMMNQYSQNMPYNAPQGYYGRGMMGQYNSPMGRQGGMMGGYAGGYADCPYDDYRGGMMRGGNVQGGCYGGQYPSTVNVEPLSVEAVEEAVQGYIDSLGDDNLELEEIMIFDNHAYAEIFEKDSGIGAMEVLIDPVTLTVSPEYGPNMMWNLKYGHMGGRGMMGWNTAPADASAEMPVDEAQAVEYAQAYLAANYPGLDADDHAEQFYGYYTLHTLENGEIVGMLSVNGYTGDVFLHTWHGDFIEMSEHGDH